MNFNETLQHKGVFKVYDHPGYSSNTLRQMAQEYGLDPREWPGDFKESAPAFNLLMATQKLLMANAVYPTIDRLVLTTQTDPPADNETSYPDPIYETFPSDEVMRSANGNPYTVGWNILTDAANGQWGSYILINETGDMINRALAGVTKSSGTSKLVVFAGSVIGAN